MIYFDTAYLLKCYLPEPQCQLVRQLLFHHRSAACCTLGRMEFDAGIHRAIREGKISSADAATVQGRMGQDELFGLWTWLPITPHIVQQVLESFELLPPRIPLRTGDPIHLTCARENGFRRDLQQRCTPSCGGPALRSPSPQRALAVTIRAKLKISGETKKEKL